MQICTLTYLYINRELSNNALTTIWPGMFDYNTQLQQLYVCMFVYICSYLPMTYRLLNNNQITHLPPGIFDHLHSLSLLYVCMLLYIANDRRCASLHILSFIAHIVYLPNNILFNSRSLAFNQFATLPTIVSASLDFLFVVFIL